MKSTDLDIEHKGVDYKGGAWGQLGNALYRAYWRVPSSERLIRQGGQARRVFLKDSPLVLKEHAALQRRHAYSPQISVSRAAKCTRSKEHPEKGLADKAARCAV